MVVTRSQSSIPIKREIPSSDAPPAKRARETTMSAAGSEEDSSSDMAALAQASSSTMVAPVGESSSSMAQPPESSPSNMAASIAKETVSAVNEKGRSSKTTAVPTKSTKEDESNDSDGAPIADQSISAAVNKGKAPEASSAPKRSTTRSKVEKNGIWNDGNEDPEGSNSRGIDLNLPPIHKLEDIFEDIARRASGLGFDTASKYLEGRTIRVATMCSGTESPILALEMLRKALPKFGCNLEFTHVFSAEIEPYKQAYIERNFHTATIFRDIREIATLKEASTAYGADQAVPQRGEVDVLVAGFACVDFSNMNRYRKGLDGELTAPKATQEASRSETEGGAASRTKATLTTEEVAASVSAPTTEEIAANVSSVLQQAPRGESGDTFFAILAYAAEKRPPLIILENIMNAPWGEIQIEWLRIGYAARFIKMDAKDYYIPHTRQRKYMLCLDQTTYGEAEDGVKKWMVIAEQLQRWASSSIEEFLLPDDDMRLADAIAELTECTRSDKPTKEVQWPRCETRHGEFRQKLHLGSARPATQRSYKGTSTMLDHGKIDWTNGQVDRIKDSLDVIWLAAASYYYDPAYKPLYVDLSQSVDRYKHRYGVTLGVIGCLTPSGMPYSTTRGGPIVGCESLALQGIPTERLLLTRETQKQLQDLAGNAMTSTVVGVAMISALIVAHEAIPRSGHGLVKVTDPRTIARVFQSNHLSPKTSISFATLQTSVTAPQFRIHATSSAQQCACEGHDGINPSTVKMYKCKDCQYSACERCAGAPRHNFRYLRASEQLYRAQPTVFREHVKDFLPMRLQLSGEIQKTFLDVENRFGASSAREQELWMAFQDAALPAFRDEYRFSSTKRFRNWTICYEGQVSRLELELSEMRAQWLLYVKVDPKLPGNAPLRKVLEAPIARMVTEPIDLLQGQWHIRLPVTTDFNIVIEGCGVQYPSWRARYGLVKALDDKVWSTVKVTVAGNTGPPGLDIDGVYTLLPHCGTANNNLHRRASGGSGEAKYLFLDPHRVGAPADDKYVFASTRNRLRYGEHRLIDASVGMTEASSRTTKASVGTTKASSGTTEASSGTTKASSKTTRSRSRTNKAKEEDDGDERTLYWRPNNTAGPQTVQCTTKGEWIDSEVALVAVSSQTATCASLQTSLTVADVTAPGCQDTNIVALACELDVSPEELPDWPVNWAEVDKANERVTFARIAWITERVRGLEGFENKWRDIQDLQQGGGTACATCCPRKPTIRWKLEEKVGKNKIVPYEDAAEAGPYERGLKARPSPTTIRIKSSHGKAQLEVSLNVITLAHRAVARLTRTGVDAGRRVRVSWKLDTCYDAAKLPTLPKLTVPDNLHDTPLAHVFHSSLANPKPRLRPDQERSLSWMVGQESDDAKPFAEEEVEESIVAPVGWRLQARAVSPRLVLGGVLADKVGYGKTITTLALIDAQKNSIVLKSEHGRLELKATLIVVPSSLLAQWKQEIQVFLGPTCNVLVISTITSLKKATIAVFQSADIVLVSHTLLTNANYLQRMAWFAARPEAPMSLSTRALAAWLHDTDEKIKEHVEELKNTTSFKGFEDKLEKRLRDAENDEALVGRVASKRLTGQAYLKSKAKGNVVGMVKGKAKASADKRSGKTTTDNKVDDQPAKVAGAADKDGDGAGVKSADQEDSKDEKKPDGSSPSARPTDPFGLSKAQAPSLLTGPLLHMFTFARVVVDEYSYLSEKDTASLKLLQTDRRWVLSGTPNLDNFAGANNLGALVGVSLGSDDGIRGLLKGQSMASTKDKTGAELFHSFVGAQSSDWHEHRHALAQTFLNQFARQNVAEIDIIPLESFHKATKQHCAERAVYLELQTQLYGQDMQLVKGKGSTVENDYVNCLNEMIASSTSPEEALLKRCSLYEVENSDGSPAEIGVLEKITCTRQNEFEKHRHNFQNELAGAAAMKQHCGETDTQYAGWVHLVEHNAYGDHEARDAMLGFISDSIRSLGPHKHAPVTDQDVSDLREKKAGLHKMAVEFVVRMRMVRYFAQLKDLEEWSRSSGSGTKQVAPCCCCQKQFQLLDDVLLLGLCGHTLCKDCFRSPKHGGTCAYEGCNGPALEYHATDMEDLINRETTVAGPKHFGSKIADVIKQIETIKAENPEDQILLFVQYRQVMKVIGDAFKAANISFDTITGAEGPARTAEAKALRAFKDKALPVVERKSVLILNASSSCAAGHNLTAANHVIFVSPFLASNQHDYDQLYEQAIGRAKRFGQSKPVSVYHFVCLKSIDVNLIEDTSGKKVVVRADGSDELDLKEWDELTEEEAAQDNGTVRFRARRAKVTEEAEEGGEPAVDEDMMEAVRLVERLELEWRAKGETVEEGEWGRDWESEGDWEKNWESEGGDDAEYMDVDEEGGDEEMMDLAEEGDGEGEGDYADRMDVDEEGADEDSVE